MTIVSGPKEYSLHVVGLLLLNAAQIVLTPPAPRVGALLDDWRRTSDGGLREEWVDNNNNTIVSRKRRALRANFNFEVDFGVRLHWFDFDQVGSYFIRTVDCFHS